MEAYAKQAKDTQLLRHAREIKLRAEYKAGELLKELSRQGLYGSGKRKSGRDPLIKTTDDFDITKDESADWQKLSDITDTAMGGFPIAVWAVFEL